MTRANLIKASLWIFPFFISSCLSEQVEPRIDCSSNPLEAVVSQVTGTECGEATGSFSLSISGGELPYTINSGLGSSESGDFLNVAAGTYEVEVSDAKGCSEIVSVSVQNLNGVNLDNLITTEAGCGNSQGSIEAEVSGGDEPYSFSLNGGSLQASSTFSGLENGSYNLTVVDASGCETTEKVDVLSGISFENTINPIIQNNCAVSGCHNGSQSPDLRSFNSIKSRAQRIKIRTANRSMPEDRTLTQTQIDQIACWVDDGAPNN